MFDALSRLGLPIAATLVVAVGFMILYEYYKHRLERERERFRHQLTLMEDVLARRFTALVEARHLLADLLHSMRHVERGDLEYVDRLQSGYRELREHAREYSLLLGDRYVSAIYAASEHALGVLAAHVELTERNVSRMQMAGLPSDIGKVLEARIGQELSISDIVQLCGESRRLVLGMAEDDKARASLNAREEEVNQAEAALLSSIPMLGEILPTQTSGRRPTPQWSGRIPHFVRPRRSL